MLCYTSGTTGNPKGVLYENRSTMLHAISGLQPSDLQFRCARCDAAGRADVPCRQLGFALGGAAAGVKFVYSAVNDARPCCAS
jgi:acyl-CoA synthetase (AMP-forming)/AMP-acid ligase II